MEAATRSSPAASSTRIPIAPVARPRSTSIGSECTVTKTMRARGRGAGSGAGLDPVETRHRTSVTITSGIAVQLRSPGRGHPPPARPRRSVAAADVTQLFCGCLWSSASSTVGRMIRLDSRAVFFPRFGRAGRGELRGRRVRTSSGLRSVKLRRGSLLLRAAVNPA